MSVEALLDAAEELSETVSRLVFNTGISHVYNPLQYAWDPYSKYIRRFAEGTKKVLFLGMNPGPWGMAQTGVPFGEVESVRDWMGITGEVNSPGETHPKRPIEGFDCIRSEVSGRRLWGLMRERFGTADSFFSHHFVANYCPLVFMEASGKNFTPDKLPAESRHALFSACDRHLRRTVQELAPLWLLGVGKFAEKRLIHLFSSGSYSIDSILHPSPANPQANRDWADNVTKKMIALGIWTEY